MLQVPFAGKIKNGETVKIECVDWYASMFPLNKTSPISNRYMCHEGPAARSRTMTLRTT